jgi:hypothetical protein
MTQRRSTVRRAAVVVVFAVSVVVLAVAGCGSSPSPTASPAAQSSSSPSLNATWSTVGQLHAPLVSTVVVSAAGFSDAERTYLVRANVAWNAIMNATSAYASPSPSTDASGTEQVLAQSVTTTTVLWSKMKAPSPRFAGLHRQAQRLVNQLSVLSQLTAKHALAATPAEKDDLAAKLATSSASIAALADQVAAKGEGLRDKFGAAPFVDSPTVAPVTGGGVQTAAPTVSATTTGDVQTPAPTVSLTTAERKQIKAILDDSMWITEPLKEAQAMMKVPLPSWSLGDQYAFCLDMGFIQATCDDWTRKKAAGPNVAYSFDQYVTGLRILRKAAGQLIYMAENLSISAGRRGAANLKKATPYISRAMEGFKVLLPSAFKK